MVLGTPAVGTDDIVVEVVVVLPFKPERDFLILGLVLRPTPTMLRLPKLPLVLQRGSHGSDNATDRSFSVSTIPIQSGQGPDQQWILVERFVLIGLVNGVAGRIHGIQVSRQRYGQLQMGIPSQQVHIV